MSLPLVVTCWIMAFYLRPKDNEAGIKILHLQFFLFAIVCEIIYAVGNIRKGVGGGVGGVLVR